MTESPPPAEEEPAKESSISRGAKWGAGTGFALATLYMSANSAPLGFYTGSGGLVLATLIGGGLLIGILGGWLYRQSATDNDRFR